MVVSNLLLATARARAIDSLALLVGTTIIFAAMSNYGMVWKLEPGHLYGSVHVNLSITHKTNRVSVYTVSAIVKHPHFVTLLVQDHQF